MAEETKIEWADATFNPWRGCTKVSPGCANCYAERDAGRFPNVMGKWGPNGTRIVAVDSTWHKVNTWNDKAGVRLKAWREHVRGWADPDFGPEEGWRIKYQEEPPHRPRVFCASFADVFENWQKDMIDNKARRLWIDRNTGFIRADEGEKDFAFGKRPMTMQDVRNRLFKLIEATPNLDWLLLTKRTDNIMSMVPDTWQKGFPRNVWAGASIEDQPTANKRIPELLKVPCNLRWLSMEPLLGPLKFLNRFNDGGFQNWLTGQFHNMTATAPDGSKFTVDTDDGKLPRIGWGVVGGESGGEGTRDFNVLWARDIRDQFQAARCPVFIKQLGSRPMERYESSRMCGPTVRLKLIDDKGGNWDEWPEDLRVREWPWSDRGAGEVAA